MQELCRETINDSDRALLHDIAQGKFAFVDFGCGTGESIGYCQKRFGLGPGFGIEVSERKLQQARKSGHAVIAADVTETTLPEGCVSFCTMLDFLEHLPSQDAGAAVLRSAGRIARDFLFVRHPSFEDIDYLAGLGLKLDWTDWIGHKNMMRLGDFAKVFRGLSWDEYVIIPQKQILDSSHPAVVPLTMPTDTVRYDAEKHGPKPLVYFNRPIWTQFDMFVRLNPAMDEKAWRRVLASVSLLEQYAALEESFARQRARQTAQLAAGQARISSLEHELNQVLTSKRYAAGTAMAEIFNRAAPDFAKPAALRAAATIYIGGRQLGGYLHRAISYPRVRKDGAWRALPGGFPPPAMPRAHLERLRVDIVVCVRDSLDDVQRCLASIDETRLPTHRVIVVDDGSGLETKRILKQYVAAHPGDLLIRHDMSHGYTKAANAGLRQADGDYVILLNSDTVSPDRRSERSPS